MTFKLSELILAIGDENVAIQNLDQCADTLDYNIKSGTKIKFGTNMPISIDGGTEKLGLVLWLPRDAVKEALAANKLKAAS
jgi:uncharacterized protein YabE (DUF348 family)